MVMRKNSHTTVSYTKEDESDTPPYAIIEKNNKEKKRFVTKGDRITKPAKPSD